MTEKLPSGGGSYTRQPDGELVRTSVTAAQGAVETEAATDATDAGQKSGRKAKVKDI